jgi:hypothetical protein
MYITTSMLKNNLYRIDKWISKDNRVGLVLLFIASSAIMLQFTSTMFYGIGLMGLICIWVVFVKARILGGQLKFDKTLYTLPTIGETIVVQRDFNCDFTKVANSRNYINQKNYQKVCKDWEFEVINIEELDDDWIVTLNYSLKGNKDLLVEVFWLDVKDCFITISDIREEKLKKILNESR